jgi:chromosome segregation ATPase
MANKYEELIYAFEKKLRKLISKYKSLQEQNAVLTVELERKQTDLMEAHKEILELRKNYDHLRMANNLSGSDAEKAESQKQIAKMVREIDKCIALLDE